MKDPYSNQLERIFNFKYPHEYESRFHEMLERKEKQRNLPAFSRETVIDEQKEKGRFVHFVHQI